MRKELLQKAVGRVNSLPCCGRCGREIDTADSDIMYEITQIGRTPICDDCFRDFWIRVNQALGGEKHEIS